MTEPDRVPLLAFAHELIAGDLVVDTWEGTEVEVTDVRATDREVTVTFTDGTNEKSTRRPGQQVIYDIQRLRSDIPDPISFDA